MRFGSGLLVVLVGFLGVIACGGAHIPAHAPSPPAVEPLPDHPVLLAPLVADAEYPRFSAEALVAAGYPDHKHVFQYPGYEPPVGEDGQTYGIYSLARGKKVLPRAGVVSLTGEARYGRFAVTHDPELPAYGILPVLEVLDWAHHELVPLLNHDCADTLQVVNPRDLDHYRELTAHAFHRLYWLRGDQVVIEPANVIFARGLASHAAFHLVAVWLLDDLAGDSPLPRWLTAGLASYVAEEGNHFLSYLAMYRRDREVILSPEATEAILAGAPDPDDETDKVQFRSAGYSAFLMVWELVEHRGGFERVVELWHRVGAGQSPDAACREVYGVDLATLATVLDATSRPEPVGDANQARAAHRPPAG